MLTRWQVHNPQGRMPRREMKPWSYTKDLFTYDHSSFIHNSPKLETVQIFNK